jgi:hypothetical protein
MHHALSRRFRCRSRNAARSECRARNDSLARGLADHYANGIIAKQIIELAKAGERDPNLLREGAIEKLREHWFGD